MKNKHPKQIAKDLRKSTKKLLKAFAEIPADKWEEKVLYEKQWSVKELLIHLIGWDERLYVEAKVWLQGKAPEPVKGTEDQFNVKNIEENRGHSPEKLLKRFTVKRDKIFELIKSLSPEETERALINDSLSDLDLSSHDKKHLRDLESVMGVVVTTEPKVV